MTDKHPMDDVPMRMASIVVDGLWEEVYIPPTQEELRAERIAAYELGRNSGLEEAAKWYAKDGWLLDEDSVPEAIRSLKR